MNNNNKHMKIVENGAKLVADLQALFYEDSNEKTILRAKLQQILKDSQFNSAIDLGAGPGLVAEVLQQHAKNLTLIELLPEYENLLKKKFPQAKVIIDSLLNVKLKQQYDLILLSHVLYYIQTTEWENVLRKLYNHLSPGGKLIVTHAPCHRIHQIFKPMVLSHNIAYMNETNVETLMTRIGPHVKDYYLSQSHYNGTLDYPFARRYVSHFFGVTEEAIPNQCQDYFDALLQLFFITRNKVGMEFHSDVYVFQKI